MPVVVRWKGLQIQEGGEQQKRLYAFDVPPPWLLSLLLSKRWCNSLKNLAAVVSLINRLGYNSAGLSAVSFWNPRYSSLTAVFCVLIVCALAHAADPRRAFGHRCRQAPQRQQERLAHKPTEPATCQYRCCGARQQECPHRMGAAGTRSRLYARLPAGTSCRLESGWLPERPPQEITPPIAQAITH